ncbi:MAG: hypothetical protein JO038_07670 [Alphaproteobacteria bacterium]|nr:hypothetical protein [Alphaproteobacteria bacterium]
MDHWSETYRGSVPPWECDVTEHFTIGYYFERIGTASLNLLEELGLLEPLRAGDTPRRFEARFTRELRAGDSYHIESAALAPAPALRLGHRVVDSATGETVTWVQEEWEPAPELAVELGRSIEQRLAEWAGPAIESRPEPSPGAATVPTAGGRATPSDLDEHGRFTPGAFVHRFSDASLQTQAAIGMNARYMQANRRGFSTFELGLRIARCPRLGDALAVRSGIAHLGNSSLRFAHRMYDPRTGQNFAAMSQFGVQLDLDARRPAALAEELRARAAALLVRTD